MASAYKRNPAWVKCTEELFVQSDMNKNGIEDYDMWSDNLEREDILMQLFDAVDTNRDSYLQLDEYEKMMKADAGTAKIVFDTIDTMESSQGRSLRPTMSSSGSL
jgi:hypothetical protein